MYKRPSSFVLHAFHAQPKLPFALLSELRDNQQHPLYRDTQRHEELYSAVNI